MSDNKELKEKLFAELDVVYDATETVLSEYVGEGNLQFPSLLLSLSVKCNWNAALMKKYDPYVRDYVRNHQAWYVTRGAHGGIMRRAEKDKKDLAAQAKERAKQQVKEALEAKLAAAKNKTEPTAE